MNFSVLIKNNGLFKFYMVNNRLISRRDRKREIISHLLYKSGVKRNVISLLTLP